MEKPKRLRLQVPLTLTMSIFALLVLFQNCKVPGADQMNGNGSGYTGTVRPEAGNYFSKLDANACPGYSGNAYDIITVREGAEKALLQNECSQTSLEVPISDLDFKPYRKDHLIHDGRIFEHEMSRSAEYFNEALCDFGDQKFGIVIRWYEAYLFHVAHLFTTTSAETTPAIRYSNYDFGNGNFGTGYQGQNLELAILDNFKIEQNALLGYFNGIINGQSYQGALGLCVTTTYACQPIQLLITSINGDPNRFDIQTQGTPTSFASGTLEFTNDIGQLTFDVHKNNSDVYDCGGYISRLNDELALGGCYNRPTNGSAPQKVMIQVRGKVLWQSALNGTVNGQLCFDTTTP